MNPSFLLFPAPRDSQGQDTATQTAQARINVSNKKIALEYKNRNYFFKNKNEVKKR